MVLVISSGIDVVVFEFGDIGEELILSVFVFFDDGLDGEVFNCWHNIIIGIIYLRREEESFYIKWGFI